MRYKYYNTQNLIPFNIMEKERHLELSRKGGIASGEKKREKALMKKQIEELVHKHWLVENLSEKEYQEYISWQRSRAGRKKKKS